eukprot:2322099-Ditylum_brightwellii.AAC.1
MKNKGRSQRTFNTGDLVLVRKQVQSNATEGVSAKLLLRAKGPYRVLRPAGDSSYWLQKLPFCRGLGRPGRE